MTVSASHRRTGTGLLRPRRLSSSICRRPRASSGLTKPVLMLVVAAAIIYVLLRLAHAQPAAGAGQAASSSASRLHGFVRNGIARDVIGPES